MRDRFMKQLEQLNNLMIEMGNMIEKAISMSVEALVTKNMELAKQAVEYDKEINSMQKEIENLCLRLLLQQQPVASDLRFVSAALNMITDMERIGDHAADISEITLLMEKTDYVANLEVIKKMATETTYMVAKSIEAYVERNMNKAEEVIKHDDIVDDLFMQEKRNLIEQINQSMNNGEEAADMLLVAKYFERIGDHATNLAEQVIERQ